MSSPPKRQIVPPLTWIVAGVMLALLLAILMTTVSKVRNGSSRRTIDSSNIRQIGQAALIYANEHEGRLPATNLGPDGKPADDERTTVHRFAAALARDAGLNDVTIYLSGLDTHPEVRLDHFRDASPAVILRDGEESEINPAFLESGISFQLIGGLNVDLPSTTPIAFTRGLREDGHWDRENGVYGSQGGHLVFLGGNVRWTRDLTSEFQLAALSGEPTENILETLTPDHAVYGHPTPPIPDGTRGIATLPEADR